MKKCIFHFLLPFLVLLSCKNQPSKESWSGERVKILNLREASNDALRTYNIERQLSFLTDDVMITTGNGTQIQGKDNLRTYISSVPPDKMYWIRTPDEIKIHEEKELAWESGKWKCFLPDEGTQPVAAGNYAAMWTKQDGVWKIKSELFVTLK